MFQGFFDVTNKYKNGTLNTACDRGLRFPSQENKCKPMYLYRINKNILRSRFFRGKDLPAMNTTTIVISDPANLSIIINGQRLPTHMTRDGVVSQIRNSQVRELGHTPLPGAQYILYQGCEIKQTRGGRETAWVNLPRITTYGSDGDEIITSYLTPIPPPPPKKQKARAYIPRQKPRRPRTGPPARRGPAIKFVPLFAACQALIEALPTAASLDELAAIHAALIDGLAIAKRVAGED